MSVDSGFDVSGLELPGGRDLGAKEPTLRSLVEDAIKLAAAVMSNVDILETSILGPVPQQGPQSRDEQPRSPLDLLILLRDTLKRDVDRLQNINRRIG